VARRRTKKKQRQKGARPTPMDSVGPSTKIAISRDSDDEDVRVHQVPSSAASVGADTTVVELGAALPDNLRRAAREGRLPERRKRNIQPTSFPRGAGGWTASSAYPGGGAVTPKGGGRGFFPWWNYYPYWYPYYYYPSYLAYPWGYSWQPGLPRRSDCASPVTDDCSALRVTRRWAIVCFMPDYNRLREHYGDDLDAIVGALLDVNAKACKTAQTEAAEEFRQRVRLAVSVLMRSEGVDIPLAPRTTSSRPPNADDFAQPWMRALMTGWV